jgi:hypothetical protein
MPLSSTSHCGAVIALAGRRIDPEPTLTARFPFDQVDRVRIGIADQLRHSHAVALVSSAACGADLVALETAQRMRLRTRIILPFSAARFRENSVVDRPRPEFWGDIFDRVASVARPHGDLVELDMVEADDAYSAVNAIIIQEARKLAGVNEHGWSRESLSLVAIVVWDGVSRGADDNTHGFVKLARHSGFQVEQVLTLNRARTRAPQQ